MSEREYQLANARRWLEVRAVWENEDTRTHDDIYYVVECLVREQDAVGVDTPKETT